MPAKAAVSRWLSSGGFLPLETENYVLDIMGEPADNFSDAGHQGQVPPLDRKLSFADACRRLPVIMSATVPMAQINIKPWGIQVAGNFRRAAAIGQWQRTAKPLPGCWPAMIRWSAGCARRGAAAASMRCASAPTRAEANRSASACRAPAAPAWCSGTDDRRRLINCGDRRRRRQPP